MTHGLELLTSAQMSRADQLAAASGVPSLTLMENAGRAVADEAQTMVQPGARILVLCGPGNNGGDGFVAARLLALRGFTADVALLGDREALQGDAGEMARRWSGAVMPLDGVEPHMLDAGLVIDALFGAGLSRAITGEAAVVVAAINASDKPVLAIDVPSGVDGTTGRATGPVVTATRTVTFFRRKPGHLLLPGRALCGDVVVRQIGIPTDVLSHLDAQPTWANAPRLWTALFPKPELDAHKYRRGHAVVVCGPAHSTGAARLGARGVLRIGAGLVTVASPPDAVAVNAAHLTAVMLAPFEGPRGLAEILSDPRRNAVLIGPGAGIGVSTRLMVQVALEYEAACVLDADALTSFTLDQDDDAEPVVNHLFALIKEQPSRPVVMTPHEGEFARVFGTLPETGGGASKLIRARAAAVVSGAVVVVKGADTVIAAPDGRAVINDNAPATLATAGSGDVLAGFITGLLAQGMPAFEAACAAVWLHGACANRFGPGLIAEDIAEQLPGVLAAAGNW